ncbi:MAG: NRAMP family divalent metal transporter [Vulcanimicrobiaceae bacterium]
MKVRLPEEPDTLPTVGVQPPVRPRGAAPWVWLLRFLAVVGPGLIVTFADTEAGSITTAAVSGAQYGMKLILLQLLLIVPLYVIQEMTVRLGIYTGKGHAQLIRERYGIGWAWVSLGTMLLTNLAALVTEFAGIAGAALIFGINPQPLVIAAAIALLLIVASGKYKRAEYAALALCSVELLFIPAAIAAHPNLGAILHQGILGSQPLGNQSYLLLVASNIGAVIMPWMIFYQQSATVEKKLRERDLPFARLDTAIGSVATQIIMIAIIVMTAATLYVHRIAVIDAAHAALALIPLAGRFAGVAFGVALIGASMLGALVVSLATSWAFGEAFGWPCSLEMPVLGAKRFYGLYALGIVGTAALVLIPGLPLIQLTVYVEAFNGFVLPIVLGFLLVLINDPKVLPRARNTWLGNTITIAISLTVVVLGFWMLVATIRAPAGG